MIYISLYLIIALFVWIYIINNWQLYSIGDFLTSASFALAWPISLPIILIDKKRQND